MKDKLLVFKVSNVYRHPFEEGDTVEYIHCLTTSLHHVEVTFWQWINRSMQAQVPELISLYVYILFLNKFFYLCASLAPSFPIDHFWFSLKGTFQLSVDSHWKERKNLERQNLQCYPQVAITWPLLNLCLTAIHLLAIRKQGCPYT